MSEGASPWPAWPAREPARPVRWIGLWRRAPPVSPSARRRLQSLKRFIFVSYAKRDEARVAPALATAAAHGHDFWIDPFEPEKRGWSADTEAAIRASRGVIVFWSVDAFASNDASREVAAAARFGKPILPLFLDDIQPADAFLHCLSVHHAIHASDPKWSRKLARALETLPLHSPRPPDQAFLREACGLPPNAASEGSCTPIRRAARPAIESDSGRSERGRISSDRWLLRQFRSLASAFAIVAGALSLALAATISGGPPSAREFALVSDEAGAAYVTFLEGLENAARRLRTTYCGRQAPERSAGAQPRKAATACAGPKS
jgi:hypothetical protein